MDKCIVNFTLNVRVQIQNYDSTYAYETRRNTRIQEEEWRKKQNQKIINFIQLSFSILSFSTNENNPSLTITDIALWLRQLFQN